MAKRLSETSKWADRWFRALPPMEKLGWLYLLDSCDAAGVIDLDRDLADFQVGASVDWDSLIKSSGDRIESIKKGKLYLTGFLAFQYGSTLSESCNAHKHVICLLERHGLGRVLEPFRNPSGRVHNKDKDKDKDKTGGCKGGNFVPPSVEEVAAYCIERGNGIDPQSFVDHYEANGWVRGKTKVKNWKAAMRTWEQNNKPKIQRLPTPEEDAVWTP